MSPMTNDEKIKTFSFVHGSVAKEPYVYDVLAEILRMQNMSLPEAKTELATVGYLKRSRNVPIPFTTSRDSQVQYIVDTLVKNYPEQVKKIVTFEFHVDDTSKKLNIDEIEELTVMLPQDEYKRIQSIRDARSLENLLALLRKYRLFNLSKLIKKASFKNDLSRVIKAELGKSIFTFKNHNIDRNQVEWAEDFCFHAQNYQAVKDSLNLSTLKTIISQYSELVLRRLKKFGIVSTDFSDYRDSKLDYIFNILLDDLSTTLPPRELVEVKNMNSLRSCLLKVDKILDPIETLNNDIVQFVKENAICSESDITGTLPEVNRELLIKWETSSNRKQAGIIAHVDDDGVHHYIDGSRFIQHLSDTSQLVLYQPEKFNQLSYIEKDKARSKLDFLARIGSKILTSEKEYEDTISLSGSQKDALIKILDDYNRYTTDQEKQRESKAQIEAQQGIRQKTKGSLLSRIFSAIFSIFTRKNKKPKIKSSSQPVTAATRTLSRETRNLYHTISENPNPVIPLSEYVEITPENEDTITKIIEELRNSNLKIVIPVYNARKVLYPRRSRKLLMADVEYILVSTSAAKSPETITEFTNSLVGRKLRNEIIPSSGILAIEKYLYTIYRQRKAMMRKKD